MKLEIFLFAIITLTACTVNGQYNESNLKLEHAAAQDKYTYKNLQLYPIRASDGFLASNKNVGNYMTLKEALAKKKIAITEQHTGDVNTLFIENVSNDTIMILTGEVVQGGKQDRMIAQDFILNPHSGKKDVSVFCVEHGRWQSQDGDMSFKEYFNISSNDVRKAATVKKDQSEVWNKVAETTGKNDASTSTGTLAALENSASFTTDLKSYTDHFEKIISSEEDIIGVIAVSGDSILGCDMFVNHGLFEKHYSNLLNSYATEAITSGKKVAVPYEKVKSYLQSIIADESKQDQEIEKKGTMLKQDNRKIHISTF